MKDQWTSRLSEYLDDELQPGERQALEAHLATCAVCRATLDELRAVVTRVQTTGDRPLKKDLWPGVARRIGVSVTPVVRDLEERRVRQRRRFAFTVPQLAAAAIVLALGSGAGAYIAFRQPPSAIRTASPAPDGGRRTADGVRLIGLLDSTARYDAAVAELQQALENGRNRLDTTTVRVLEQNLAIIDRAIAEARAALTDDPSSTYLSMHLAQTMRTKLELLRRAQTLAVRS